MDATTTPTVAKAVLGEDVNYHEIEVDVPEFVEVVWVPYSTGKSSRVNGGEAAATGKRAEAVWAASVKRYGSQEGA